MEANPSDRKVRARRVESLRKLTRMSRRAFALKYGIAPTSLQNWEDQNGNGLPEKGAERFIKALKTHGIHCSLEWLLYGKGNPPVISEALFNQSAKGKCYEPLADDAQAKLIQVELATFCKNNAEAVYYEVEDDGMEPAFYSKDIVAGIKRYKEDIATVLEQDCIIMTDSIDILVRRVKAGNIPGTYNLFCINPQTSVAKPTLYDVELHYAAPVVWVRRKDT